MSDEEELSEAERREVARAEGTDMPTPMATPPPMPTARSAFANPTPEDEARRAAQTPTPASPDKELLTKTANTLRGLRWSDEPLLLTAVKTGTWFFIGLAIIFELYITSPFFQPPGAGTPPL